MPYPRLASNSLGRTCSDGPDGRPTAGDDGPSPGLIDVLYGSDGFFRFLSLKCEHRSRVHPRSSPCSVVPCTLTSHSHFLRKERMSRPKRAKLNNGGAFW